ncbi:hypothetical protein O5831_05660 [Escherichia coli]|nr:hypothetical protein [Escherichia coli]EFM2163609.1 hypothetical protein [Escherichia coli]MCV8729708.1 hypothetical protein [Escherichia coli]MCZ5273513.1 hypothetical protein [Escherichia coli]MCZ5474794.1 hypothetical protein [Escherichia coli]
MSGAAFLRKINVFSGEQALTAMRICFYPDVIPGYKKFAQAIAVDNFVQADVRKIDTNLLSTPRFLTVICHFHAR